MSIVFYSQNDDPEPWREAFGRALPQMPFNVWPDCGPASAVRYALIWKPPPGMLTKFTDLKAILSLSAGVDDLLANPDVPRNVPIVRLLDAGYAQQMAEYAIFAVICFQHRMPELFRQRSGAVWRQLEPALASRWSVGVMGLGALGGYTARTIAGLGYPVAGWSRSVKRVEGVTTFSGTTQFGEFLSRSRVVVNMLPLTAGTRGILNRATFSQMPRDGYIVNIARGAHLIEEDLLESLDSGQLGGAMLDVFETEPLPESHPFWRHPKVLVTPHVAGVTIASEAQAQVIDNVKKMECGETPLGLVDREKGY